MKPKGTSMPSKIRRDMSLLIQAWTAALDGTPVTYLSGPITTGIRFFKWYKKQGRYLKPGSPRFVTSHKKHVIGPNEKQLVRTAKKLRIEQKHAVIEPASLKIREWESEHYLQLWAGVIERFSTRVVMMPQWQFSAGCAAEILRALHLGIPVYELNGAQISSTDAIEKLRHAISAFQSVDAPIASLEKSFRRMKAANRPTASYKGPTTYLRKDESLNYLAEKINVAQFVSFSPGKAGLKQEYSRVLGFSPNQKFSSVRVAIERLLERSSERSINLRSYYPHDPKSREFIYGLKSVDAAIDAAARLHAEGLHVIANETVDVHDGGVSGVSLGDVIEFAPDDTPRCVEKAGTASLYRRWALDIFSIVYGFAPELNASVAGRLEFSIHPKPRGWRHSYTLGWEYESTSTLLNPKLNWPNKFSRMLGDKVFGLLIAHQIGLPVPRTTVITRRVAPFSFGLETGSYEKWIRTSPHEQTPGKFTTQKGWTDPFELMRHDDPNHQDIASILAQAAVPAKYSGAAIVTADGQLVVEGLAGEGEGFMKGSVGPRSLPSPTRKRVTELYEAARDVLGPVRFEWVDDGKQSWIVQLHRGETRSLADEIVPGDAKNWVSFESTQGLEHLRKLLEELPTASGLLVSGDVGLTSHIADVIRKAGVPAKLHQ